MTERDPESDVSDEELVALLADLRTTLTALRDELDETDGRGSARSPFRPPRPPFRPPRFRDVLRFTEEYTIPTVVAILEANVRLLELVQGLLRAVDPEKSATRADSGESTAVRDAAGASGHAAADRLSSGLSNLQRALSATDLPENPEARRLLDEAQDLSTEVQRRLGEAGEQADLSRYAERESEETAGRENGTEDSAGVDIEVTGESDSTDDEGVDVDVEAELRSIKDEFGEGETGSEDGSGAGDGEDDGSAGESGDS